MLPYHSVYFAKILYDEHLTKPLESFVSEFIGRLLHLHKYMLFAGWEGRIVKNCDRGLENAAQGCRPRAAFSSPRSQFFTIRTDPKLANNLFIFSCDKLAYNWVYETLLLNWFTCRLQTIAKNLTRERASNSDTRQGKMY